jgi:hypothetical protein
MSGGNDAHPVDDLIRRPVPGQISLLAFWRRANGDPPRSQSGPGGARSYQPRWRAGWTRSRRSPDRAREPWPTSLSDDFTPSVRQSLDATAALPSIGPLYAATPRDGDSAGARGGLHPIGPAATYPDPSRRRSAHPAFDRSSVRSVLVRASAVILRTSMCRNELSITCPDRTDVLAGSRQGTP